MHHDHPLIIIRTFFCCQNIHILRSGREILVLCDLQNVRARYSVVQWYTGTVRYSCQNGHVFHYGSIERMYKMMIFTLDNNFNCGTAGGGGGGLQ